MEAKHNFCYIDRGGWLTLGGGFIFAFLPFFVGKLHWILSYLRILVHELGHSFFAWIFGYPSIPTFNLRQGGGLAVNAPQANWLLVILAIIFIVMLIKNGKNIKGMVALLCGLALYLVCLFSSMHTIIGLYMGKGFEVIFAAIFLYCAISGTAVHHSVERFLYAFLAFFLVYENIVFSWRLLFDKLFRAEYFKGIAPGLLNDFYIIWMKYFNNISFDIIVLIHLCITILLPVCALLLHYAVCRSRAIEGISMDIDEGESSRITPDENA